MGTRKTLCNVRIRGFSQSKAPGAWLLHIPEVCALSVLLRQTQHQALNPFTFPRGHLKQTIFQRRQWEYFPSLKLFWQCDTDIPPMKWWDQCLLFQRQWICTIFLAKTWQKWFFSVFVFYLWGCVVGMPWTEGWWTGCLSLWTLRFPHP